MKDEFYLKINLGAAKPPGQCLKKHGVDPREGA